MHPKHLVTCIILSFAMVCAEVLPAGDIVTQYGRYTKWNTNFGDPTGGSDSEANAANSVWKYEAVSAPASPDNGLGGASPWYGLPAAGTVSWDAANSRWTGPTSGYPRFEGDRLMSRMSGSVFGAQPRVVWKAPQTGTVDLGGSFGFVASDNSARPVEWAIAKRSGTTYSLLASGISNTPTPEPTYGMGSMGESVGSLIMSAGRKVELRYPTLGGVPVTDRKFPFIVVGHGSALTGVNSASLYAHMVPKGFVIVAPTFTGSSSWGTDVSLIITDMLARTDLPIQLDPKRIGYSGTSMGGITGLTKYRISLYDSRIKAIYVRAASTSSGSSAYNWDVNLPLLMLHGTADGTVSYSGGHRNYLEDAKAPKGFITLQGVGHDMGLPINLLPIRATFTMTFPRRFSATS